MPHSTKSARSAIMGRGPKPRPYKQGLSEGRAAALARAKKEAPGYSTRFHLSGANFAGKPKGPRIIKFASDAQRESFYYGPYPLMCSGGYGASKTFGLCLKAMYLSSMYPRNRGLIARKQGNKLEKTTMKTFFKVCPPEAYSEGPGRRSDQAKTLVLNNGSEIIWSQLDDSEILETLRGLEINWFIVDQAEEVSEEVIEVLMRRLGRWDQAEVPQQLIDAEHAAGREWPWRNEETGQYLTPTYAMFACNPDHELHWIYRRFHPDSPEWKETYSKQGYKMIMFDSTKNIFLPAQNKDLLLQGTKEFVARFVHGQWGIPEGQIHKIDAMSLLRMTPELEKHLSECKLSRTLDHGETSPTCCVWWALDRWGNLFAYREYYQPDRLISFHRQRIYEMSLKKGVNHIAGQRTEEWVPEQYVSELADPSIFNPRLQRGNSVSVAQEYMEVNEERTDKHNAIFWDRADNNELGTRNRINELLTLDPEHKHPLTGKKGAPRLYFIERSPEYPMGCFELIRETRSARRVKIGTQDGRDIFSDERDDSITDHAYDCASGSTLVVTPDGHIPISELPSIGFVLTPRGWRQYTDCKKYRENAPVMEVQFEDGRRVTTTPDHLFKTPKGWVRADELTNKTVCGMVTEWTPKSSLPQSKSFLGLPTIAAGSTTSAKDDGFIASFGKTPMAQSLLDITSTTRTKTDPIIGSETWSASSGQLTSHVIARASFVRRLLQRCKQHLKSGTEVLRGVLGIGSISNSPFNPLTSETLGSSVPSVESASQHPVDAPPAKSELQSIADRFAAPVVFARPIRVITVQPKSPEDVYCLTVLDGEASFCVEGGIVIHNCLRYRCADMDALPVEAIRRPPPGSVAHTIAEMKKESRRAARPRGDGTSRVLDLARLPPQLATYYRRKVS